MTSMKSLATLLFGAVLAFAIPANVNAQLDFAGYVGLPIPCTCSAGTVWYIPMLMTFPYFGPGAMAYLPPPASLLLADWNIFTPDVVLLGQYTPVHACLMGVPPACVPAPALGTIIHTGTSLGPSL